MKILGSLSGQLIVRDQADPLSSRVGMEMHRAMPGRSLIRPSGSTSDLEGPQS